MLEVVKLNTRGVFLGPCHIQKQPPEMFCKKAAEVFFKISQNSQESTCVGVSFRSLKKRLKRRCFSVKCAQFLRFKNSYFEKKIFKQLTASVHDCDRIGISQMFVKGLITPLNQPTCNTAMKAPEQFKQAFTCSKLTIETLEQGVNYIQS